MGVDFERYDVSEDEEALHRVMDEYQSRVTATVVVDGEVFRGFGRHKEEIAALLKE